MGPRGKWIDGISADGSVAAAARTSLSARLTAVAHWLPLAAYHAGEDVEHVHRLRVSTRRAMAALRLYREWLRVKRYRWMRRRLKKVRRAAGDARDLDVIAERTEHELGDRAGPLLAEIRRLREAAQPAIVRVAEKCRRDDRLVRKIGKLVEGIQAPCGQEQTTLSFREWAEQRLASTVEAFFSVTCGPDSDAAALHQLRIRAKELRYAVELLAPAFGPELREVHYPVVEELQERLGRIQDCVAGVARIREWESKGGMAELHELLEEMARHHEAGFGREREEFFQWWTAERQSAFKAGLVPNRDWTGEASSACEATELRAGD